MIQKLKKKLGGILTNARVSSQLEKLDPSEKELLQTIREKRLTYLTEQKLVSIVNTCNEIKAQNLPGLFLEAGCALGGSSILISKLKNPSRPFGIYDVFGMIPPPTAEDPKEVHERYETILKGESSGMGGDKYYGYEANLYDIVQENLKSFDINIQKESIVLHQGLVQETMNIKEPVAFAHIDVDWYDPVKTCLEQTFPNLVVGGSIILDDYNDWGGCRKATDEYLAPFKGQYKLDDSAVSMKITRIK